MAPWPAANSNWAECSTKGDHYRAADHPSLPITVRPKGPLLGPQQGPHLKMVPDLILSHICMQLPGVISLVAANVAILRRGRGGGGVTVAPPGWTLDTGQPRGHMSQDTVSQRPAGHHPLPHRPARPTPRHPSRPTLTNHPRRHPPSPIPLSLARISPAPIWVANHKGVRPIPIDGRDAGDLGRQFFFSCGPYLRSGGFFSLFFFCSDYEGRFLAGRAARTRSL